MPFLAPSAQRLGEGRQEPFAQWADFPRFKRKVHGESFRYPDSNQFEIDPANGRMKLPKLGWIRYRNSRDIAGVAKKITRS